MTVFMTYVFFLIKVFCFVHDCGMFRGTEEKKRFCHATRPIYWITLLFMHFFFKLALNFGRYSDNFFKNSIQFRNLILVIYKMRFEWLNVLRCFFQGIVSTIREAIASILGYDICISLWRDLLSNDNQVAIAAEVLSIGTSRAFSTEIEKYL